MQRAGTITTQVPEPESPETEREEPREVSMCASGMAVRSHRASRSSSGWRCHQVTASGYIGSTYSHLPCLSTS